MDLLQSPCSSSEKVLAFLFYVSYFHVSSNTEKYKDHIFIYSCRSDLIYYNAFILLGNRYRICLNNWLEFIFIQENVFVVLANYYIIWLFLSYIYDVFLKLDQYFLSYCLHILKSRIFFLQFGTAYVKTQLSQVPMTIAKTKEVC